MLLRPVGFHKIHLAVRIIAATVNRIAAAGIYDKTERRITGRHPVQMNRIPFGTSLIRISLAVSAGKHCGGESSSVTCEVYGYREENKRKAGRDAINLWLVVKERNKDGIQMDLMCSFEGVERVDNVDF